MDRTAYPRFSRGLPVKELHVSFSPDLGEIEWARRRTYSDEGVLALLVSLKSFQRLGRFPDFDEVPAGVVEHVRGVCGLARSVRWEPVPQRSAKRYRQWARERVGVRLDVPRALGLAEDVMRRGALAKDNPADLINMALEELVRARLELPGYSSLDRLAATVRTEVNESFVALVRSRLHEQDLAAMARLMVVDPVTRRSGFEDLKRRPGRAAVEHVRKHVEHLGWLCSLGEAERWVQGVPPAKVAHLAALVWDLDVSNLARMSRDRRAALLACLVHERLGVVRDELATMYCKQVAGMHRRAKERFEQVRESARETSERLLDVFGDVLGALRQVMAPTEEEQVAGAPVQDVQEFLRRAGGAVMTTLADAGGVEKLSQAHEEVAAFHGGNHLPFLEVKYRGQRSVMFDLVEALQLASTTRDERVLRVLAVVVDQRRRRQDFVPDHVDGRELDLSFVSGQWRAMLRRRGHEHRLHRRSLEMCALTYLAEELRSGDVAVVGSKSYADLNGQLLSWAECQDDLADFCAEAGLPAGARAMRQELHRRLSRAAADVDVSYPDNADLVIDEAGVPVLRRRRGAARRASAIALERDILARLPERDLLDVVTRVAYWTGWPRHLGPVSGSDPKIRDAFGRYVLMGFCYGTNVGPAQFARHMPDVSAHQLATSFEHAGVERLHAAHTDVVNAYARLEMPAVWGDGTRAAADGSQVDTWSDNLLAESHIRYGGYGGIAYRLIADNYIALFTRFIPCGVWEANYIIQGLLDNTSDVQPTAVHADTQGQSLPVFGLAFLLGIELLPRIRNWKDLVFYRPDRTSVYQHVDPLFAPDKAIDWDLIETHWPDLIRVAMSIRAGKLDSVALLRRLGNDSRKNRLYRAFRELGRVMRTIVLMRYLSEPALRDSIAVVTNRMESYNAFCQWIGFGREELASNDPDKQEKIVKLTELLANCQIFSTTVDITETVNDMAAEGRVVERQDLATIGPLITSRTRRFGRWLLRLEPPGPVPEALNVPDDPAPEESAPGDAPNIAPAAGAVESASDNQGYLK